MKVQVRLSPSNKTKGPAKSSSRRQTTPKLRGTGVAAVRQDYPASTNVSSPIQAVSRRRLVQLKGKTAGRDLHTNRYTEDEFANSDEEDESDGFAPLYKQRKPRNSKKRPLGPPIKVDDQFAELTEMQQVVVEDFMIHAKNKSQEILVENGLARVPFTDTMLREMAINFPQNERELLEITGIDPEKIRLYGKAFLALIRKAHQWYEQIMQPQEDRPQDPNHQNVINISSDEELGDDKGSDDSEDDKNSPEERSAYFPQDPEVDGFNARCRPP